MRRAGELLESWKIPTGELEYGKNIGGGGQADVFFGWFQGLPVAIKKQRGGGDRLKERGRAHSRLEQRRVRRKVGGRARVRLHVDAPLFRVKSVSLQIK